MNINMYADYMQRAKIVINFPWTMDTYPSVVPYQMKARVFEACLCGTLLVEGENPYTPRWLNPGEDYVSYETDVSARLDYYTSNPDTNLNIELVKKVKYYLANEEERLAIANRGCKKVADNYNARKFWELILQRVGL
jgi:spore maturation protein CgeB